MEIWDIVNIQSDLHTLCVVKDDEGKVEKLKYCCYCLDVPQNQFICTGSSIISCNIAHQMSNVKILQQNHLPKALISCLDNTNNALHLYTCDLNGDENTLVQFTTLPVGPDCTPSSIDQIACQISDSKFCYGFGHNLLLADFAKSTKISLNVPLHYIRSAMFGYMSRSKGSPTIVFVCHSANQDYFKALCVDDVLNVTINDFKDVSYLMPQAYAAVIMCAKTQTHVQSVDADYSTYICTNRGQLVFFKSGKLTKCLKIPVNDAKRIDIFVTPSFRKILVILSSTGGVCFIDETDFQILKTFPGAYGFLIDDFIQSGSEQLLIYFDYSLEKFILTDFEAVNLNTEKSSGSASDQQQNGVDSFGQVLKALTHRLQVGKTSLIEAEERLREKDLLIEATCKSIHSMALGETGPIKYCEQGPLLPLVPYVSAPSPSQDVLPSCTQVHVISTWKRMLFSKIIIGVKCRNDGQSAMNRPSLQLMPTHNPYRKESTASLSKTFVLPIVSGTSIGIPVNKKQKQEVRCSRRFIDAQQVMEMGQVFYCVSSMPVEQVAEWGHMGMTLCLHWDKESSKNSKRTKRNCCSAVIGYESVKGMDLNMLGLACCNSDSNSNSDTQVTPQEDELCLLAVQSCTTLSVRSCVSPVTALQHVLQTTLHFTHNDGYDCLVCCENRGPFYHVRSRVEENDKYHATLTLWTRDECQLLLLLRALYSHLPDDLLILPTNHTPHNITSAIKAMHQELSLATSMNCGSEEVDNLAGGEPSEIGHVIVKKRGLEADVNVREARKNTDQAILTLVKHNR